MNTKEKMKEILLAEVYSDCFEDEQLNTALEELATLFKKEMDKEYLRGIRNANKVVDRAMEDNYRKVIKFIKENKDE